MTAHVRGAGRGHDATFPAFMLSKGPGGAIVHAIVERSVRDLEAGEVLIRVAFSSLNYKDALAAAGHPGIVQHFPHTPGIDAAGTVVTGNESVSEGARVLVTGFGLGTAISGGVCRVYPGARRVGRAGARRHGL